MWFIKMNTRQQDLKELNEYIGTMEKETTLLLQNFQWDLKHLLESMTMVTCKYVETHRIPLDTRKAHEERCFLALHGYSKKDILLPDPIDSEASTVVKLNKQDIMQIINKASLSNPSFRRVLLSGKLLRNMTSRKLYSFDISCGGPEPLSVERLQLAYSADERRAIHDAVVSAAPACHDLADLALTSNTNGAQKSKVKSRAEILAELRDMKRRRTKYRVAAKTRNYSDVLRDVIRTQMETYAEAKGVFIKTEYGSKSYISLNKPSDGGQNISKKVPPPIIIKQERMSPDEDRYSESSRRYRERSRSRDRYYNKYGRKHEDTESKKRRNHDNVDNLSERKRYRELGPDRDKNASSERRRNDDDQIIKHKDRSKAVDPTRDRLYDHRKRRSDIKHEFRDSNDSHRYDNYRNSKHDRSYGSCSIDTNRNESRSRERSRSNNDDYYQRKLEGYQNRSKDSDRHREGKRKLYHELKIKEEKLDDHGNRADDGFDGSRKTANS